MSVLINASTSSGIGLTSDNSGVIQFQSNGTNTTSIAANGTLTSSNLTTTGRVTAGNVTLSASGLITFADATTQSTAATAGAWVKVATTNVTSSVATVDFTNLGSYRAIKVTISDVRPVNDGQEFNMRISSDNGATFIGAGTYYANTGASSFNGLLNNNGDEWLIADELGNAATDGGAGCELTLLNFNIAQKTILISSAVMFNLTGVGQQRIYSAFQNGQTAMNAIRFYFQTGNVSQGLFMVEGWTGS